MESASPVEVAMMKTGTTTLRFRGSGARLRLRVAPVAQPLTNVRECCRASVAVEKALGEAIRQALATGHSWAEVADALGVEASTPTGVRDSYEASRRLMRSRFWDGG